MENKRSCIAICGSRLFSEDAMMLIDELNKVGREKGFFTVAFTANRDSEVEDDEIKGAYQLFELLQYVDVKAVLVLAETLKNEKLISFITETAQKRSIPVFILGRKRAACHNLSMDFLSGFELVVRHVVEHHKCRRINFIAGIKGNSFSEERIEIFKKVLRENGIEPDERRISYGDFWDGPTKRAAQEIVDSDLELPEAIICVNDFTAINTCEVLRENKINVPEDVIVTGFDGITSGKMHYPSITTAEPDYARLARYMIDEVEEGRGIPEKEIDYTIKYRLREGQSCGCVPMTIDNQWNQTVSELMDELNDCVTHTECMNEMVTAVLAKSNVGDIAKELMYDASRWKNYFRFTAVKQEVIDCVEIPDHFGKMSVLMRAEGGEFEEPGQTFDVREFVPEIRKIRTFENKVSTCVVRLVNFGSTVYGYMVEGFENINTREIQRCNEYGMFLSNAIQVVTYNNRLKKLNSTLSKAYKEIEVLSVEDPLTRVYNRRGFLSRLTALLNDEKNRDNYLTIISVDMDMLKFVNDNFGHAEGDFALRSIADALKAGTDGQGIVARFGGDEFSCALVGPRHDETSDSVCKKLNDYLKDIKIRSGKKYDIGASVGICQRKISDGIDVEDMINKADSEMYAEKIKRKKQRR